MIDLSKEQIEKRNEYYIRLKGRHAIITNPYYTKLAKDTRFQIMGYLENDGVFKILGYDHGNYGYCLPDEFQLIDKEFSDFKIIKKGIRTERKDKFGDKFMLELQNNKRDIYLSSSTVSLLNLNSEENYVGFATDPDTGIMYVFSADKVSGYLLNKDNNRITSVADWREMFKLYETMNFEIIPQPIIDNNNPGFIFYTVKPNFDYFGKEQPVNQQNRVTKQKEKSNNIVGKGIYHQLDVESCNIHYTPPVSTLRPELLYDDVDIPLKTQTTSYITSQQLLEDKIREMQKFKKIELVERKDKNQH